MYNFIHENTASKLKDQPTKTIKYVQHKFRNVSIYNTQITYYAIVDDGLRRETVKNIESNIIILLIENVFFEFGVTGATIIINTRKSSTEKRSSYALYY